MYRIIFLNFHNLNLLEKYFEEMLLWENLVKYEIEAWIESVEVFKKFRRKLEPEDYTNSICSTNWLLGVLKIER